MNKKKKNQLDRRTKELCMFTAVVLVCVFVAICANTPARKEEQKQWPPPGDIDDMSVDDLQKLLDQSLEQGIFELASFYRDKIRERTGVKKTG